MGRESKPVLMAGLMSAPTEMIRRADLERRTGQTGINTSVNTKMTRKMARVTARAVADPLVRGVAKEVDREAIHRSQRTSSYGLGTVGAAAYLATTRMATMARTPRMRTALMMTHASVQ